LKLVKEFLIEQSTSDAHITLIMDLLAFVMNNSYLSFHNQVYHQIDGTAMGTTCAPTYANIVVYMLERSVVKEFQHVNNSLHLYRRYLDDIFAYIDARDAERFMKRMNELHPKLQFEFVSHSTEAAFLDLAIFKGERFHRDGRFDLRVHQKKMNLYLYIPYLSFHTPAAKKSFIQTELMRYIRNTSNQSDYNDLKWIFYQRLRDRGYPKEFLNRIFDSIYYVDRDWFLLSSSELLNHPRLQSEMPRSTCLIRRIERARTTALWTPHQHPTPPVFVIPYTPLSAAVPIRRILCDRWELIPSSMQLSRPIIAYQSYPSLMVKLIHEKARKHKEKRDKLSSSHPAKTIQSRLNFASIAASHTITSQ